ncbi:hypothetical protein FA13DRAFT_161716 [Coprinellus micaceus]|uniref:Uncharacterized protein n=1 Tax=Coprinellus micaceus TaxID=71717 RepID=A0A4Y7THV5_COPMI|nr:hypothetical protein FA13DRAFT_161716 [Coprinellus micaceus]
MKQGGPRVAGFGRWGNAWHVGGSSPHILYPSAGGTLLPPRVLLPSDPSPPPHHHQILRPLNVTGTRRSISAWRPVSGTTWHSHGRPCFF